MKAMFCICPSPTIYSHFWEKRLNVFRLYGRNSASFSKISTPKSSNLFLIENSHPRAAVNSDGFETVDNEDGFGTVDNNKERFYNINDILQMAQKEGSNFVFDCNSDEGEEDEFINDDDPFVSRSIDVNDQNALSSAIIPSSEDMTKILSAYHEAPPSYIEIDAKELEQLLSQSSPNPLLVDIRSKSEFNAGHIQGSTNFSVQELLYYLEQNNFGSNHHQLILICDSGLRSLRAAYEISTILKIDNLMCVKDGIKSWIELGHNLVLD